VDAVDRNRIRWRHLVACDCIRRVEEKVLALFAGSVEVADPVAVGIWSVPIVTLGGTVDVVPVSVACPVGEPVAEVQVLWLKEFDERCPRSVRRGFLAWIELHCLGYSDGTTSENFR
jgi:hypothetical protein